MKTNSTKGKELVGKSLSFRATKETARQLADLMKHWEENRTQALSRAIQIAWDRHFKGAKR